MSFEMKENKTRKLTQAQVEEIRYWAAQGATQSSLCRHFGMSVGQIGRIIRGESWKASVTAAGPTPAQRDATLARLLAAQRLKDELPDMLADAKLFKEIMDQPRAHEPQREFVYPPRLNVEAELAELAVPVDPKIPLSPLDGGDIPDVVEGAVDVLQDKARAQGVDIDKMLK